MKVPEADRQTSGEAAEARAAGGFVCGFAEDLGSEDVLALCGGKGSGLTRMRHSGLPMPGARLAAAQAALKER